jgi:hypothetical protein
MVKVSPLLIVEAPDIEVVKEAALTFGANAITCMNNNRTMINFFILLQSREFAPHHDDVGC